MKTIRFILIGTTTLLGIFLFALVSITGFNTTTQEVSNILGMPLKQPPEWAVALPIIDPLFRMFFNFFSLHGLITLGTILLICLFGWLSTLTYKVSKKPKLMTIERTTLQNQFIEALREQKDLEK